MKTQNDVLSFEDIETHRIDQFNLWCKHNSHLYNEQLYERFIHTFLEWNLYDKYIYHLGWTLKYISVSQGDCNPIISTTRVDTLQEAEIIAMKKISRYLGIQIHLEQNTMVNGDLYKVIDKVGAYHGIIEIQQD